MKLTSGDNSKKVASILLEIGAVLFWRNKPFRFDSGILSPVYVDTRLLISRPKERKFVIDSLIPIIKNDFGVPDVVAGVATAGIPHAAWIADRLNLPMIFVRPKPKDHGRGNLVEGSLKRGQEVLIVEDLVSTAGSSLRVIEAVRKLGSMISGEVSIFTYHFKAAQDNLKKARVTLFSLTDIETVTAVGMKKGYLKKDQINTVMEWVHDPQGWGKKMGYEK